MNAMITDPAETTQPGRPKHTNRKIIAIFLAIIAVLVIVAAGWFVLRQNSQAIKPIIGVWYSESQNLQYHFLADNTFFVTNGQQTLINGQWRISWKKSTLIMIYANEGESHKESTRYTFSDDLDQVVLQFNNTSELVIVRIMND